MDAYPLIQSHRHLKTLAECAAWCEDARRYLEAWPLTLDQLTAKQTAARQALEDASARAKARPIWKRLMKSSDQKDARVSLDLATHDRDQAQKFATELHQLLAETPENDIDRASRISMFKEQKKQLILQKKELDLRMKEIRADARNASARAGTLAQVGMRKAAAASRRSITVDRAQALRPFENTKMDVEREILNIDKEIARLASL